MTKKDYQYRAVVKRKALYFYTCEQCGKKRNSRIYGRAVVKVCQVCRKNQVPENQPSLFENNEERYRITEDGRELLRQAEENNVDVKEMLDCQHVFGNIDDPDGERVCVKCGYIMPIK